MTWWWLSSKVMTVGVATDDALIVRDSAPVVRRFIGQPIKRLADWMRRQGGFRAARIGS